MAQKQKIFLPTFISSINYDAARVLPHIYFYNGTKACEPYYIQNISASAQVQEEFPYFDNYSGNVTTTSSLSLLYNNEAAVYGEAPSASLYSEYWEKYVELLYNPRTRIMNCSAIIPLADYFKMDLNDIVQFRGNHYHLRAINNYNLSNGECDLELLGPILGDVLANILPGVQCEFDFDIEDVYYGWTITTCGEPAVTYEVTFNTTSSIVPGMIISASSEISGCWTISGSVTQSSMDYYDVGIYGTYTTCASCSATPPPTSSFYVSKCDDTAQLTFDFTSSLSMSIGNVFTLPSAYALEGCWYVSSSYSGATDLSDVIISQSFVDCATCETPPSSSYLVINCENTSSTYYVTFFDDIIPANVFTSTTGSLSGSCWSVSGSASVAPAISDVGVLANYANCSYCLGVPVEYQIDNAASGDSTSACSGATTTSIVYADPGYTVPFVSMILYDSAALTTPFIGSTGWRKLTGPLGVYAVEITVIGEITNYVTCP
jgi:hypothetical protein